MQDKKKKSESKKIIRTKVQAIIAFPEDRNDSLEICFIKGGNVITSDFLSRTETELFTDPKTKGTGSGRYHKSYNQFIIEKLDIIYTNLEYQEMIDFHNKMLNERKSCKK